MSKDNLLKELLGLSPNKLFISKSISGYDGRLEPERGLSVEWVSIYFNFFTVLVLLWSPSAGTETFDRLDF